MRTLSHGEDTAGYLQEAVAEARPGGRSGTHRQGPPRRRRHLGVCCVSQNTSVRWCSPYAMALARHWSTVCGISRSPRLGFAVILGSDAIVPYRLHHHAFLRCSSIPKGLAAGSAGSAGSALPKLALWRRPNTSGQLLFWSW